MHLFSPHMVQNSLTGIVHALLAVCVIRLYIKPQVNKLPLPCSTAPCHRHVLPTNTYNELIYPPTQTIHVAKRSYEQTMIVLRTRETPTSQDTWTTCLLCMQWNNAWAKTRIFFFVYKPVIPGGWFTQLNIELRYTIMSQTTNYFITTLTRPL